MPTKTNNRTSKKPSRPVLRWFGGKWVIAPWIIKHFPPHEVYTEAFGGAGSVLLKKPRSKAEIWNDLENEVVILFRVLQDRKQSAALKRALYLTPFSREEWKKAYELSEDPVETSRRLVIRSYMGFSADAHSRTANSGFRYGSNGSRTTPARDWSNYPGALAAAIKRLRGVVIENRDAFKVLIHHDGASTLHYVDPPYVHGTRAHKPRNGHQYDHELFAKGHEDLAIILKNLKGMVVLSGYESDFYNRLYPGWKTFSRKAFGFGTREKTEVIWLNELAVSRLNA